MANDINIAPNPIQRNQRDVTLELTKMYLDMFSLDSLEEMQEVIQRHSLKINSYAFSYKSY